MKKCSTWVGAVLRLGPSLFIFSVSDEEKKVLHDRHFENEMKGKLMVASNLAKSYNTLRFDRIS
jgi:hypothetical protein